jgi:hypothetical protein
VSLREGILMELYRLLSMYSDTQITTETFSMRSKTILFFPFFKVSREDQVQLENVLLELKKFVKEEFGAYVPLTHPTFMGIYEFPTLLHIMEHFYRYAVEDLESMELIKYES